MGEGAPVWSSRRTAFHRFFVLTSSFYQPATLLKQPAAISIRRDDAVGMTWW